jgi:peptidyl-prolyl cis-trans isomerase A (cyclophilin A)
MRIFSILAGVALLCMACGGGSSPDHVVIQTRLGDIEVQLFPDKAPLTTAAFLRYVDSGYYERAAFYRILSRDNQPTGANAAELIQGGAYLNAGKRGALQGTPHEPTSITGLLHTHGTISMARQAPGTATTEFFICIGDNPGFDHGGAGNADGEGYAAFGQVVKGMDVVLRIYRRPEVDQRFEPPIAIMGIHRK